MKRLAVIGLLILPAVSTEASSISALRSDPDAARVFDFCSWAEASPDAVVPDLTPVLERTDPSATEAQYAASALIDAGVKVARGAGSPKTCRRQFLEGEKLFTKRLERHRKQRKGQKPYQPASDPEIRRVQQQIREFWVEDQAGRRTYIELRGDDAEGSRLWAGRLAVANAAMVDARSTRALRALAETYGWIDAHRFGPRISTHAWILVQHADDHPEFQAQVLEAMKPYVDNGGVTKSDYAYLWDRVAVNHDRKQRYGTQPIWKCKDGRLELAPLEQPETVDERRATMGLGPVQDALDEMSRNSCG